MNRITGRLAFALLKDEGITHLFGNPGTTELPIMHPLKDCPGASAVRPLVRMAEPLVKWAAEVTRLEDLPQIVRRAAKIATTPPTGPVFISFARDILNAEAGM